MDPIDLTTLEPGLLATAHNLAEESGLLAVADAAIERTGDIGQAAAIVGDVVDVLIDFSALDLGPLGAFLEDHDDDMAARLAQVVISIAMDEERRASRKARRLERRVRRADRQAGRQARRTARRA